MLDTTLRRLFSLQFKLGHFALRQQFFVPTKFKKRIGNNWTVHSPCYWSYGKASGYPTVERGTFPITNALLSAGSWTFQLNSLHIVSCAKHGALMWDGSREHVNKMF
jgi:hypothetical protein